MSKTKVALLGAGFIADIHIESYHRFVPDAEVVAVYSRNAKRAEAFAKKHGIARSFADLDQAITQSGCEVADVCLPNFLHHRAVLAAANAGQHVIIEKPLALTLEQADEMIAACWAASPTPPACTRPCPRCVTRAARAARTTCSVSSSLKASPSAWRRTV